MRDSETKQVAARVVPDTSAPTLTGMVADRAGHGADVSNDEALIADGTYARLQQEEAHSCSSM